MPHPRKVVPQCSLILLACVLLGSTALGAERPNILYFYVDDMGWGAIGPNGQAQRKANGLAYVRTPNIDRLADEGVNFQRGYGCHVCSPARSSQQSGFHQGHTFADRNDPDNAKKAMRADDVLMGDALSAAGYVTGYWGKWGYGGSKDLVDPKIDNVQTLPTSHGYQYVLAELHHVRAHTFFQPTLWSAPAAADAVGGIELIPNSMGHYRSNADYPDTPALQNDPGYPRTAYCDDSYAFAALDFVRAQGTNYNKTGQPFFGLLAVQIPHAPFGEIAKLPHWDEAYADDPLFEPLAEQTRQWMAMVTRIDAHFGNILAALEDPNNDGDTSDSIADNTLVVFQSDNGGPRGKNDEELNTNGGLRGHKSQIQEGGIRVPLVMRWPARIHDTSPLKAGTNSQRVVDVTDLLPTFCELAGAAPPLGIDGVSLAPTLLGQGHQRKREFLIHEAGNGQSLIRGNLKLVRTKKGEFELYDLAADEAEKNDIAATNSELVEELAALLLGERVTEPKGFAYTYHHWTGENGASISDPGNWSDYRYENAGITYMTDDGAPKLSWVARIVNPGTERQTTLVDEDVEFLALEIRGGREGEFPQALLLEPNVNLTGRNEIRVGAGGFLGIDGGTVSTLRWIDIAPDAAVAGNGTIEGTVYHDGLFVVAGKQAPQLRVRGDLFQAEQARLRLRLDGVREAVLSVEGKARIGGTLSASWINGFRPQSGESYTAIASRELTGRFRNPNNEVVMEDGTRLAIRYTDTAVTLTVK